MTGRVALLTDPTGLIECLAWCQVAKGFIEADIEQAVNSMRLMQGDPTAAQETFDTFRSRVDAYGFKDAAVMTFDPAYEAIDGAYQAKQSWDAGCYEDSGRHAFRFTNGSVNTVATSVGAAKGFGLARAEPRPSSDFPTTPTKDDLLPGLPTGAPKPVGLGSTGRAVPGDLAEQLAMAEVRSAPGGAPLNMRKPMGDPRWPATDGWIKMSQRVNGIEIHYVRNTISGAVDDFKFANPFNPLVKTLSWRSIVG